ncbi:MAG TPA: HAD family hydrolase [Ardenticatenaceae bacterium]|nr:HAD family hydrolase [Ardenticatenaceae bacterium]
MKQRALFLDRDGTLVHPRHYPSRPEDLVVYEGIGPELCRLQEAGFRVVVITNQSGIARGYFTEDDLQRMHDHLARQLAPAGVRVDGVYYCPHHPEGVVHELAVACGCRKPEPGMLLQAAAELDLDLRRSWVLGDILDDVQAGNQAGCHTILIDLGTESLPTSPGRRPAFVARDTLHALQIVAAVEGVSLGEAPALDYLPASWQLVGMTDDGGRRTVGENGRGVTRDPAREAQGVVVAERGAHDDAG